jgi:hypothetical protein
MWSPNDHTKELAMNAIIVDLSQCIPDGNEYILLDVTVAYQNNPDVARA